MKLIKDNPGITASEIAKQMKIKPNYMYRVLGDLAEGRPGQEVRAASTRPPSGRLPSGSRRSMTGRESAALDRVALLAQLGDRGVDPLAEKSPISSPSTTVHSPPEQVHG